MSRQSSDREGKPLASAAARFLYTECQSFLMPANRGKAMKRMQDNKIYRRQKFAELLMPECTLSVLLHARHACSTH